MSVLERFRLNGRRALITGSSTGIGYALAQALCEAGAHVVLNGRDTTRLAQAEKKLLDVGLDAYSHLSLPPIFRVHLTFTAHTCLAPAT